MGSAIVSSRTGLHEEPRTMSRHRGLLSLAVSVLIGLMAGDAHAAGVIEMTVETNGATLDLASFGATFSSTTYDMDATALASLNAALIRIGSGYQFTEIVGTSNYPGNPTGPSGAQLEVH